ncbi:MAG: metal dependent phosphohydrolase [Rhodospirillales bacterium]|jgi:(p)ppGpp synthase/HD superfamily hydrolase|nr:metal dependent phosphohydrolase [Rhodospirillales bacterium]
MHLGQRFERALIYALHVHGGHVRKGTSVPYFSHLMAVSATVIENGGTETEAIAALLHDAVEDQGGTQRLVDIRDRFGEDVAAIVEARSDSLQDTAGAAKKDWLARKREYLAVLASKSRAIHRVSAADKLHNARAICRDAEADGNILWERFSKPQDQTIAYYTALSRQLCAVFPGPLSNELRVAVGLMERHILDPREHQRYMEQLLPAG